MKIRKPQIADGALKVKKTKPIGTTIVDEKGNHLATIYRNEITISKAFTGLPDLLKAAINFISEAEQAINENERIEVPPEQINDMMIALDKMGVEFD